MDKKIYSDYNKVCGEIKLLEETKSVLSKTILEDMGDAKTIKTDYGTFSLVEREKYAYSEACKLVKSSFKDKIKKAQEDDIIAGNVTLEIAKSLMFRSKVDNNKTK